MLHNTKVFLGAREEYLLTGQYTKALPGTYQFNEFWKEEQRKCIEGVSVGNLYIPGTYYFYLNYTRMLLKDESTGRKTQGFPRFTDVDLEFFSLIEQARKDKKGFIMVKPRRTGFSYKNAALVTHEYNFYKDAKCIISAFENKYSDNTMQMTLNNLNFLDQATIWYKPRNPNTQDYVKARHLRKMEDGREIWVGFQSEIKKITFKDNPFASAGLSSSIFLFEEAGIFNNIIESYNISEPCWKDGDDVIGLPIIYGCLCAGAKVWTKEGKLINIENLKQEDGLLGYNGNQIMEQTINWFKPPANKPCYRITTDNGDTIECSDDHPLLITRRNFFKGKNGKYIKKAIYQEAKEIKINDQILLPFKINKFGNINIPYARELGLLIGDGNYSINSNPTLSCSENETLEYLENKYGKLSYSKHYKINDSQEYHQLSLPFLKEYLINHKMYGQVKLDKRLPFDVHMFNKTSVAELLAGYFDADGNVYYNKKKNIVRVVLTSVVKELLYEVKHQLHKFGIHCNIVKENRNTKPEKKYQGQQDYIYRLYINQQQDLELFKNNINLLSSKKKNNLQYIKKSKYKITECLFEINPLNNKEGYFNSEILKDLRYTTVTKVEYIGEQKVYNLNCGPNHNYISNGFITRQTGGDMLAGTAAFSEMYYDPDRFNLLTFPNIWESDKNNQKCGWFLPSTKQRFGVYTDKETKKTIKLVDDDGNSNEEYSLKSILDFRETKKGNPQAYRDAVTQYPLTPSEAFLITAGNMFPTMLLNERLAELRGNPKKYIEVNWIGNFIISEEGDLRFQAQDNVMPLRDYPIKKKPDDDITGCIEIYEQPQKENDGKITPRRYIVSIDTFDDDQATTNSVGCALVFDRFTRRIVAEYTGRPQLAKDFYENVRKLIIYYNAIGFPEINKLGFVTYMEHKKCLYMLAETPVQLRDKIEWKPNLNTSYGFKATDRTNSWGRELIREWLLEPIENDSEILNVMRIRSTGLIQELIKWNKDGNFDRVSSLIGALILDVTMNREIIQAQEKRSKSFAESSFWKEKGFLKDDYDPITEVNSYKDNTLFFQNLFK